MPRGKRYQMSGVDTEHDARESAYAIRIGDRWFYEIKRGRVMTAWSLAGAKLMLRHQVVDAAADIVERLEGKPARGIVDIVRVKLGAVLVHDCEDAVREGLVRVIGGIDGRA